MNPGKQGCIFCKMRKKQKNAAQGGIIFKGKSSFIVMNAYPYNNGHLMIAPYRHLGKIEKLSMKELTEIMLLMQKTVKVLKQVLHPDGFNIGFNVGRSAGAGIDTHLHLHIVPRWNGDTNFMPVISGTKVISQSLEELYHILRQKFISEGKNE